MDFPFGQVEALDFGRLLFQRAGGGRLLLPVAPCLLRLAQRVVLVDAGFDPGLAERVDGVDWQRPARTPLEQLGGLGLTPDDVSDVLLTHLHDDHASGVLDRATGDPVYPNARVHVQETAIWRGLEKVSQGGERFVSPMLVEWLLESERAVRHHGDWRLCDEVAVLHTGGHTPGHQIALVGDGLLRRTDDGADGDRRLVWRPAGDGSGDLLLGGDLLSLPACFAPDFRTSSDVDPETARLRRAELADGARRGLACWLYHGTAGRRLWRAAT